MLQYKLFVFLADSDMLNCNIIECCLSNEAKKNGFNQTIYKSSTGLHYANNIQKLTETVPAYYKEVFSAKKE